MIFIEVKGLILFFRNFLFVLDIGCRRRRGRKDRGRVYMYCSDGYRREGVFWS